VVQRVGKYAQDLARKRYGAENPVPEIRLEGHLDTTFPYILSHLEYIIGELLRNSIDATITHNRLRDGKYPARGLPPINVLICHAPKHVIFRVSDQGGGILPDETKDLWSFAKSKRSDTVRLKNFAQVPKMAGTLQELQKISDQESDSEVLGSNSDNSNEDESKSKEKTKGERSLHTLTYRPPDLKLGMGLPMTRVYAEYWGGSLQQTSMEGHGTDVFLHIEKLGNRLEQLNIDQL
jgi:pyruvate dehydrogenase kinase 2/3/4